MAKEVPQFVKTSLRAVLLSCQKDQKGIKQTCVEKDYHKVTTSKLDVKKYGYQDLYEFLLAIPDVARLEYSVKDGENRVFGVADKTVFMSDHAKKAAGIPNGLKPLPPSEWPRNKASKDRTVVEDKASLKVTVESDEKKKIVPNARGLYALHIRNLPPGCQENEVSRIFIRQYRSLREVKIENSSRAAFVRFSNHADAVRALGDMNGYNLRGSTLTINPAIERMSQQNAKVSKDKTGKLKVDMAKKSKNTVITNGFVDQKTVVTELKPGSSVNSASTSIKEIKTVVPPENWEAGNALSPKMVAVENKKFFSQNNFDTCVHKEDGSYPIHVSNFPLGTTQESLKQMFSACGDIVHVKLNDKFAFIYFNKQEEAVTALHKMKGTKIWDKCLTVTPKTPKGKAKQQDKLSAGASGLHHASSQSSVSSCDSLPPKSPVSDTACGFGANTNGYTLTEINNDIPGYMGSSSSVGQKQERGNISNAGISYASKEVGKLKESKNPSCSSKTVAENGWPNFNNKPQSAKQREPVHTLLNYVEMCELVKRCKKPLRTLANIGAQEFDILVTDVIDSCHFWANIDDQIGSYKKLEQIRTDLQIVEHHKRCMPVKYQLGASLFEDNKWYRCWCLEVSKLERKEAKVFYIDYGNGEWISWDQFTDIHKKFWDLAPQAVPFKLAGLENASNLSPEISNEGSEYLRALICNKVCRARTCQPSDAKKPHIIEVELIRVEGNVPVNKQMALTRYVQETRKAPHVVQGPLHNHSIQEINPTPSQQQTAMTPQPQQPAKQTPPRPFVNTQDAQATQAAVQFAQPVQQSMNQEPLPSMQSEHSQQCSGSSQASPAWSPRSGQDKIGQQSLQQDQKVEPVKKSPPRTLQHQQQMPSYMYQLFEKKEVIEILLSYVGSADDLNFFMADHKTKESLQRMSRALTTDVNPNAKIYPRVGDIVVRISEKGKMYRVRIKSIPKSAAFGIDTVAVQNVDYGWTEEVPLSSLCELPPQSLRYLPPQVMKGKLAGIKTKPGKQFHQAIITKLIAVKTRKKPIQASVVKRQEDGVLHVELFESEGPSLNVHLLKMNCVQLDESQRSLFCANFTSSGSDDSGLSPTQRSNNLPLTGNQNPKWHPQEKFHHIDNQSNHSDWEDSLIEIEEDWMDATPVTGARKDANRQSWDHLYMPPPPEMHSPSSAGLASNVPLSIPLPSDIRPPSSGGSVSSGTDEIRPPSASASASSVPHNVRFPSSGGSGSASSGPHGIPSHSDIRPLSSGGSVSSGTHDMRPPSAAASASSFPPNVRLPSSGRSGSASSGPLGIPFPSNIRPPSSEGSVSSETHDMWPTSAAASASSVPPNIRLPSSGGSGSGSASGVPLDIRSPSTVTSASSVPPNIRLPSAAASMGNGPPDIRLASSGASVSSRPLDIRPPSSSGSESSDVLSHTSSEGLPGAVQELNVTKTEYGTALNREEKSLQDKRAAQHYEEPTEQKDWIQERNELLERDEQLKRILDMPRSEMKKMISLRQEKEKLERKIRMKGLENQILKLRKELNQLELKKGELVRDMSQE